MVAHAKHRGAKIVVAIATAWLLTRTLRVTHGFWLIARFRLRARRWSALSAYGTGGALGTFLSLAHGAGRWRFGHCLCEFDFGSNCGRRFGCVLPARTAFAASFSAAARVACASATLAASA